MKAVALVDDIEYGIVSSHIYDVVDIAGYSIHVTTKKGDIICFIDNFKLLKDDPNQNFRTSFFKRIFKSFSWNKR